MPTMKFNKEEAVEARVAEVSAAPTQALSTNTSPSAGMEGEFNTRDLQLPRINLIQRTSELVGTFKPGAIVFDKTLAIADKDAAAKVTFLRLRKQYQEDLPFGSEVFPRVFNSAKEVFANGGSTTYGDEGYFTEVAHIQVAIEAPDKLPDELSDLFAHEHNGKSYAMAVLTVSKTNYGSLARPLITAAFEKLRDGLFNGNYELKSVEKKSPKGTYYVMVPAFKGRHTPEDAAFFQSLIA